MDEDINVESEEENEVFFKEDIKKLQLLCEQEGVNSNLSGLTMSVKKSEKNYDEKKEHGLKTLCVPMKRYRGPPVTRLCGDKKNLTEVNTRKERGGTVCQKKVKRNRVLTRGMKKKMDEDFVGDEEGRRKVKKREIDSNENALNSSDEGNNMDTNEDVNIRKMKQNEKIIRARQREQIKKAKVMEIQVKKKSEMGTFEIETVELKERKGKTFTCTICKCIFDTIGLRHLHVRDIHGTNEMTCYECGEGFDAERSLMTHIEMHEKSKKDLITCEECGKSFLYKSHKTRHMLSHSKEVNFFCPEKECRESKGFKSMSDYKCHMATHRSDKIPCSFGGCFYVGATKHQVGDHFRWVHGPMKQCPNKIRGCTFESRDNRRLKKHVNSACKHNA